MKHVLAVFTLIGFLVACAPEPTNVSVSPFARPFAKISVAIERDKAFVGLRNALDNSRAPFVVIGTLQRMEGFHTFWSSVAGQSAMVYFKLEADAANTVIRVLTEPSPPPFPERLARDLDLVADEMAFKLGLSGYKLEPDR
jgi:hypothetical protein